MTTTNGKIKDTVAPAAARILLVAASGNQMDEDLSFIAEIDRAHLVMLAECGLVEPPHVARLLLAIRRLMDAGFAPIHGAPLTRGLVPAYEEYLARTEGADAEGILHTARSHNDMNATVLKLRIRRPFTDLVREGLRLLAVVLRRARLYSGAVMPIYTNHQPAVPGTYGHYLLGIACALDRDIAGLLDAASDLRVSPLGAGAAGGNSLRIDPLRTAELLGFEEPALNSLDAVASRDLVLRLLSAAAVHGLTLNRLATDLLTWASGEYGFLELPDRLVGLSAAMPQQRSPFLLEHVQGRTAGALGAFVTASAAMRGDPFTHSIASGTEAMRPVWGGFSDIVDSSVLVRMVLQGVRLNRRAMYKRAREGFTSAGALANLLLEHQLPLHEAQRWAGEIVGQALETHATLEEAAKIYLRRRGISINLEALAPDEVCGALAYGGGPARNCTLESVRHLAKRWSVYRESLTRQTCRWRDAQNELAAAVAEFCEEKPASRTPVSRVKPISIETAWVERTAYAAAVRCQSTANEA